MPAALPDSEVLVLRAPQSEVMEVGVQLRQLVGVDSVTVDPQRGQLVVRYEPRKLDASRMREAVRPPSRAGSDDLWIWLLPKLARGLVAVASFA